MSDERVAIDIRLGGDAPPSPAESAACNAAIDQLLPVCAAIAARWGPKMVLDALLSAYVTMALHQVGAGATTSALQETMANLPRMAAALRGPAAPPRGSA